MQNRPTMEKVTNDLKNGIVNVVFRKQDRSHRAMKATLKPSVMGLGNAHNMPSAGETPDSSGMFTVFDVEANDWRRFYWFDMVEYNAVAA